MSVVTIEDMVEYAQRELQQGDPIEAAIIEFLTAVRDDPDAEPASKVKARRPAQASLL